MAKNCPYFVSGKCNNPGSPMAHDCSWPGDDYAKCSVYRLITNPEAARRELLAAFAGRPAPATLPGSAATPQKMPTSSTGTPCRCCGRLKTAASCPSCGYTDREAIYGALVLFVLFTTLTLFLFRSTFWTITGWVISGVSLLIGVVTVIINVRAHRRAELRGTVTDKHGDAIYGDDAGYNKDRYYGRVANGASFVLLDRTVCQDQYGLDIIKVRIVMDTLDVRNCGKVCWISLNKTSLVHRLLRK